CREIRRHEVIEIKVAPIVITDGAFTSHVVDEPEIPRIVSRGPDESVQRGTRTTCSWMVIVDIYMRLVPCRTRVLETHGLQVIRRTWIVGIEQALDGRRQGGIAAGSAR